MTLFFIAGSGHDNFENSKIERYLDNFLFAMDKITSNTIKYIKFIIKLNKNVLIDSGIYSLASEYSKKKNIPINKVFALNPENFDGFEELYKKYFKIITPIKNDVWGYIEMDIGGQENKIKIREKIEKKGLHPIPVYHPLSDEGDYFDYLAKKYDRICIGNLAQSEHPDKIKIIYNINKRRKKYPNLWIHYLGITLNQYTFMFNIDSCDSSKWSSIVRFGRVENSFLLKEYSFIEKNIHDYNDVNRHKVFKLSSINVKSRIINFTNYNREMHGSNI